MILANFLLIVSTFEKCSKCNVLLIWSSSVLFLVLINVNRRKCLIANRTYIFVKWYRIIRKRSSFYRRGSSYQMSILLRAHLKQDIYHFFLITRFFNKDRSDNVFVEVGKHFGPFGQLFFSWQRRSRSMLLMMILKLLRF